MTKQDALNLLTNEIEQGFMQRGGWKACRYLLGKLVADKDAEIQRLKELCDNLVDQVVGLEQLTNELAG